MSRKVSQLPTLASLGAGAIFPVVQGGITYQAEAQTDVANAHAVKNLPYFDVRHYGTWIENSTAAALTNAATLLEAIAVCSDEGGGTVLLPRGVYYLTSNAVDTDEGPALELGESIGKVTICGAGRDVTILRPNSNKVELFLQNGATDISFEDLTFHNPDGPLQNQVKPGTNVPGGGVAGLGNLANTAIRQARGANLTVRRVHFESFLCDIHYIGTIDDENTLVGTLRQHDVWHDGCAFGALVEQPERVINTGDMRSTDVVVSSNASSDDPGHELYVSNRDGAHPKLVYVESSTAQNGHSSSIKIRKGELVVFGQILSENCGRGPEIINCKRVAGGTVVTKLSASATPTDSQRSALAIIDCGPAEIAHAVLDVRGADAWGVRVATDLDTEAWHNRECRLSNVTVINDYSGGTGKSPFFVQGQEDFVLNGARFVHEGTISATRPAVDVRDCDRALIIEPKHQANGAPADAARLVKIDAECNDCEVRYWRTDISATFASNTVEDLGTNTTVTRLERHRVGADRGNAAATLAVGIFEQTQIWNTPLTTDRACALSTSGARNGDRFRIVRTAAATGAFSLNVGAGPLKALAPGQWCDVEFNGSVWTLTGAGAL